ncbi:MAG TPA: hypothetical protein VG325_05495 [Solirubrobacteraceae bacterium]|nr:hypothetical protein [Solirubrobacteraceae bacterium]
MAWISARAVRRAVSPGTVVALLSIIAASGAVAPVAAAKAPAGDCQPYAGRPCLLPFPDNRLTRSDPTSHTGLRVRLPQAAMPANTKGARVGVAPYNRDDGFSPGSAIVLHIAGLDNAGALRRTGAVPLTDESRSFARRQPILLIDQATGRRQLIWAELDANAKGAANTDLLIHPAKNLTEGHTYIVALRNLRRANGRMIAAPRWFALLRDGRKLPRAERPQTGRYARIFSTLRKAGVAVNASLYEAWNFTIESRQSLTDRMLAIRNSAFAQLGDTNLGDGTDSGRAPAFAVTDTKPLTSPTGATLTQVDGTLQVPCYLLVCGAGTAPGFHYSSAKPDAVPTQIPGNVATTPFECIVPSVAGAADPARISLYGHGLLGSRSEVAEPWVEALASQHDMVFCATDFWGLAQADTLNDAVALSNLSLFPAVIDRLQQGALNTLYLGRLMLNPGGLAASSAFQQAGHPRIETSELYYDGNSQGGIEGGMLTALAPDFRRAVLGVTGIDYANLLVQRSTDFAPFGSILNANYKDQSLHPLILDLMQQMWDRGEPGGYAQQMTSHPLPDTPSHQVLMQIAYGDHQVSMYAAAVEARTVGASAYQPALARTTNRVRDRNLFYGIPAITRFPFRGSAIDIWDSGPGHTQPPPLGNLAPANTSANVDPHQDPRDTPAAQTQVSDFLAPNGSTVDVCGAAPCRSYDYTP